MICFYKYLILFLVLFWVGGLLAQRGQNNAQKNPRIQTKISVSPVLAFYKVNRHHAGKATQKMAFCFSVKEEIRIDKKSQSFIAIGVEYFLHGLKFNSYYFPKDSIKLYNGNMNATYNLTIQEIDFPVLIKRSFQRENNALLSGYFFASYSYRLLIKSQLSVSYYGDEAAYDNGNLQFKIPAFSTNASSFLSAGAGFQKNNPNKHKSVYGEIQYKYGLSPLYIKQKYAPSSLFISSHFVCLTVGIKI